MSAWITSEDKTRKTNLNVQIKDCPNIPCYTKKKPSPFINKQLWDVFFCRKTRFWKKNMGAAGPGQHILAQSVQLELIWQEVKDSQQVSVTKSPLNLWLFEICVAKALCETPGARPSPLLYVEQEKGGSWAKRGRREREREGAGAVKALLSGYSAKEKNKPENLGCLQVLKHF